MKEQLRSDVIERLKFDYGLKHRTNTDYMRGVLARSAGRRRFTPALMLRG